MQYAEPAVFPDFPLRLGELFRESGGFTKGAWGCACGRGASGGQGLSPPLDPLKGFHPLTRFRWRDYL